MKKSLGQNFLRDPKILRRIADFAHIEKSDKVVEIGPGEGTLTKFILEKANKVIAIEKDRELVKYIKEKFKEEINKNKLEIIEGDILGVDTTDLGEYKLVGNIPYNITGEIFRKFLENKNSPQSITFVIQREVAERIVARDNKESVLSISVQAYGEPELGGIIKAGSFSPAPKVDSCLISIRKINKKRFEESRVVEEDFFIFLKAGFAHKRKLLLSNLVSKDIFDRETLEEVFEKNKISMKVRAEDLSIEQWFAIIKACQAKK